MNIQLQATEAELYAQRRACWTPTCKRRAWLEHWTGWRWCGRCWWRNFRYGGSSLASKWCDIESVKLYFPKDL